MPVRTQKLAVGNSAPFGTSKTLYTCPAGETTIVKDIRVENGGTGGNLVVVFLSSGAGDVAVLRSTLAANDIASRELWAVLRPGDLIRIFASAGTCNAWISGAELEGLAD